MLSAELSRQQLAKRLGWVSAQVALMFTGRCAARLDQIEAMLRIFGRPLVGTSEAT